MISKYFLSLVSHKRNVFDLVQFWPSAFIVTSYYLFFCFSLSGVYGLEPILSGVNLLSIVLCWKSCEIAYLNTKIGELGFCNFGQHHWCIDFANPPPVRFISVVSLNDILSKQHFLGGRVVNFEIQDCSCKML